MIENKQDGGVDMTFDVEVKFADVEAPVSMEAYKRAKEAGDCYTAIMREGDKCEHCGRYGEIVLRPASNMSLVEFQAKYMGRVH